MAPRATQSVLLTLGANPASPRVSQGALLVLGQEIPPIQVDQAILLVLGRKPGRRILTTIDTGYIT